MSKSKKTRRKMYLITVHIAPLQLYLLKKLVNDGMFPSISAAVRIAIRDFIHKEMEKLKQLKELLPGEECD